jgi:hypothetical protein
MQAKFPLTPPFSPCKPLRAPVRLQMPRVVQKRCFCSIADACLAQWHRHLHSKCEFSSLARAPIYLRLSSVRASSSARLQLPQSRTRCSTVPIRCFRFPSLACAGRSEAINPGICNAPELLVRLAKSNACVLWCVCNRRRRVSTCVISTRDACLCLPELRNYQV